MRPEVDPSGLGEGPAAGAREHDRGERQGHAGDPQDGVRNPRPSPGVEDGGVAPAAPAARGEHGRTRVHERPGAAPVPGLPDQTGGKIAARAGLGDVRFHDLRHTYASLARTPQKGGADGGCQREAGAQPPQHHRTLLTTSAVRGLG